jgi:hypothetical protein
MTESLLIKAANRFDGIATGVTEDNKDTEATIRR